MNITLSKYKIHNKKDIYGIFLVLLFLLSQTMKIELSFGIIIDFSSIGYILLLIIFTNKKSLFFVIIFSLYRIGISDVKVLEILRLLEVMSLVYLFKKYKSSNIMLYDVLYWGIFAAPLLYILFYFLYPDLQHFSGYFYFQIVFIVVNSVFNAFIAEIIYSYFLKMILKKERISVNFKTIFLHFLTIAILVPFIASILIGIIKTNNNISNNVDVYAKEVFHYISDEVKSWDDTNIINLNLSAAIETGVLQGVIQTHSRYKPFNINIINKSEVVILSVNNQNKYIENEDDYNKKEIYNEYLHKMIPINSDCELFSTKWINGFFVYTRDIEDTGFTVYIEVPIYIYKDSIMVEYISQFKFLLFFIIFISIIAMILNRIIFNDLTKIAVNTNNISKLLDDKIDFSWPNSNIMEIKYLVDNVIGMADELRFNFKEMKKSEKKLYELAYYDTLTTLPNRLLFKNVLNDFTIDSNMKNKIGIIFIDLNRFKVINDTLGHDIGDKLLKSVSNRLKQIENKNINVFRLGGDEFVVLAKIKKKNEIISVGEKIKNQFERSFELDELILNVTCSLGASVYPDDSKDINNIIKFADIAMYISKEEDDGNIQLFNDEIKDLVYEKLTIEKEIFNALANKEFKVYYQPKFDAKTEKIKSIEALVRWYSENLGVVSPDKFISIAEESDLILEIDRLVLKEACKRNKFLQNQGYPKIPISINISPRCFRSSEIKNVILEALAESNLEPKYLIIEITEGVLIKNINIVKRNIEELKEIGVLVSIDDFGKGHSSFSQVLNLPISEVKIDKLFTVNIDKDYKSLNIVKSIIELAHNLGLNVVAEGIEKQEQKEMLSKLDCDELQGYYFAKPMNYKELTSILKGEIYIK